MADKTCPTLCGAYVAEANRVLVWWTLTSKLTEPNQSYGNDA